MACLIKKLKTLLFFIFPPKKNISRSNAFSTMEVMVTLAIMVIFSLSVGAVAWKSLARAKSAGARNQIALFEMALTSYYIDNRQFPDTHQGLKALWTQPVGVNTWRGPYLNSAPPKDPWGNSYNYSIGGSHGLPYEIISLGADGISGGAGDDSDIVSWQKE